MCIPQQGVFFDKSRTFVTVRKNQLYKRVCSDMKNLFAAFP
jgi:hypothetical protein